MNSTLVDRLHDALIDEVYDGASGALTDDQLTAMVRKLAETAAAVFEKAHIPHTPTDDEREALSEFLFTVYEHGTQPNALKEADAILTFLAGLRRSEVPEPSVEDFRARIADERARQVDLGYDILHDRHHGVDHLLGWAQDYARRGRTVQAAALIEAARELYARSPQGEPSDAQREAAWIEWKDGCLTRPPKQSFEAGWRAALRAASEAWSQGR